MLLLIGEAIETITCMDEPECFKIYGAVSVMADRVELIKAKFKEVFGTDGGKIRLARAPGRVNLIGEHTDYNGGFVLPIAINQDIITVFQPRSDREVRLYSYNFSSSHKFSLDDIRYEEKEKWANYVKGVIRLMQEKGLRLSGMNMVLEGNVAVGAGLSSSAAIEVAVAVSLILLNGFKINPVDVIKLCQKAENEFVGVRCGIMDQFICMLGEKDKCLFLDCRRLEYELVPLPDHGEIKVVVCNTGVKRGLAGSEYNKRRKECEEGVHYLKKYLPGIKALRDVTVADFEKHKNHLPETVGKRCRHVIEENERVIQSITSLKQGDLKKFGRLMNESHESLKNYYEVSCKELDLMAEIARGLDGVLGTRMTGGGFGGCTVNLVESNRVGKFKKTAGEKYRKATGINPEIYVCTAEQGAGEVKEENSD